MRATRKLLCVMLWWGPLASHAAWHPPAGFLPVDEHRAILAEFTPAVGGQVVRKLAEGGGGASATWDGTPKDYLVALDPGFRESSVQGGEMARSGRRRRRASKGGDDLLDVLGGRRPSKDQARGCPVWLPAGACDCRNPLPITNSVVCHLDGEELVAVLNSKYVLSVEPVGTISLQQGLLPSQPDTTARAKEVLPWGLDRVNQRDLPLDRDADVERGGSSGVHVYVLDSGIKREHEEFAVKDPATGRTVSRVVPGVSAV